MSRIGYSGTERNSPETFINPSRYRETEFPENKMDQKKKPDLRDGITPTTVTNTQSRMAGGADNPNVSVDENPHIAKPGAPDQRVPEGQGSKGD